MTTVDLSKYQNTWYSHGAGKLKRWLWMLVSECVFRPHWFTHYRTKIFILKLFGANIGEGVVIKPNVTIKQPWRLCIGNHTWLGEGVWIDNIDTVTIGDNCCISQGALLETGNHNYKDPHFSLQTGPIIIENGAWIGARAVVAAGVRVGTHAVLAMGSVATTHLKPYGIYQGNPAIWKKNRDLG